MAHGCNIDPFTMGQPTEEAQRGALAELVGAIPNLDTSPYWGEGKTSANDGQRFSLSRKVLQQTYRPRCSDFVLEFYTFLADNYALFYNESDLELEAHYPDTHRYTEVNFAAFTRLGRRFCPRIRGLKHQRIYRINP